MCAITAENLDISVETVNRNSIIKKLITQKKHVKQGDPKPCVFRSINKTGKTLRVNKIKQNNNNKKRKLDPLSLIHILHKSSVHQHKCV